MSGMDEAQRQSFQKRIQRISAGGSNTMRPNQVATLAGAQGRSGTRRNATKAQKAALRKLQGKRKRKTQDGRIAGAIAALMVGGASFLVGRAAAHRLTEKGGVFTQDLAGVPVALFGDLAIAAVLAFVLSQVFGFSTRLSRGAVVAGFAAMMAGESYLMRAYPDLFTALFSESYVTSAVAAPIALL